MMRCCLNVQFQGQRVKLQGTFVLQFLAAVDFINHKDPSTDALFKQTIGCTRRFVCTLTCSKLSD